jgi:hypothetical protein
MDDSYIQQKMDEIWLEAVRIQEEDLSVDEETLDVLYEGRTEVLTTMVVSKLNLSQEDAEKVTWILGGLAIGGGVRGEEGECNEMLDGLFTGWDFKELDDAVQGIDLLEKMGGVDVRVLEYMRHIHNGIVTRRYLNKEGGME